MSYRIYLQVPNGSAFERTETGSRAIAESVFQSFLERDELDCKEVSVHLVYQRTTLAVHRFNAENGTRDDWQGRWTRFPGLKDMDKWAGQQNWKAVLAAMSIWTRSVLHGPKSWVRAISVKVFGLR